MSPVSLTTWTSLIFVTARHSTFVTEFKNLASESFSQYWPHFGLRFQFANSVDPDVLWGRYGSLRGI